jgi:hypothetical protein
VGEEWEVLTLSPARRLPLEAAAAKVYDIFTIAEQAQLVKAAELLPLPWVQRLRVARSSTSASAPKKPAAASRDVDLVEPSSSSGPKERRAARSVWSRSATTSSRRSSGSQPADPERPHERRARHYREARRPLDDDYLFFPLGFHKASAPSRGPTRPAARRPVDALLVGQGRRELSGVRYRSLHMNRHTLGTNLSRRRRGDRDDQEWLGHADPKTTKIYVHNSRSRLQRGRGALDAYRKAQGGGISHWASVFSPREQLYRSYLVWRRDGGSWREWGTARACGLR